MLKCDFGNLKIIVEILNKIILTFTICLFQDYYSKTFGVINFKLK